MYSFCKASTKIDGRTCHQQPSYNCDDEAPSGRRQCGDFWEDTPYVVCHYQSPHISVGTTTSW